MKNLVLISIFALFGTISFAQSNDWTKDDRNNVFDECMSATSKYKNVNKEQQESLSLCYLDEITKKYSKKEFQAKIDIEIKRIQQATIAQCAKNIGVSLEPTTDKPLELKEVVQSKSKVNEGNFTRNDLVGIWRDENSKTYFNDDATYLVKWDNGKSQGGKWWINSDRLVIMEGYSKIVIITFDGKNLKYQQRGLLAGKSIYNATKIE